MTCRDGLSPRSLLCTGAQAPRAEPPPPPPFPPTAQLWSRHPVGETAPHSGQLDGKGRSHLAGALQSSRPAPQSGLAPGEGASQTVSLCAVPAGDTMPSDLVGRSPKTPGIDSYHRKPESVPDGHLANAVATWCSHLPSLPSPWG